MTWTASDRLTEVNLPILSAGKCKAAFQKYNSSYLVGYDFDEETQLCAGTNEVSQSFCASDIGLNIFFAFNFYTHQF